MGSSKIGRSRTRREFLGDAARVGAVVAVTASGLRTVTPASAQAAPPFRVGVLMEDTADATAADFARGNQRGVQIETTNGRAVLRSTSGGEFTSGAMALSFAATHLGLHWNVHSRAANAVAIALRTSSDGQTWSEWQPLSIEAVADSARTTGSTESAIPVHGHGAEISADGPVRRKVFASLVAGQDSRFVQYQTTFGGNEAVELDTMTVTAINSAPDEGSGGHQLASVTASSQSSVTLSGGGASISVITREGWGCDERYRFARRGTEIWPEMYVPTRKIVVHHTATGNTYSDGAAEVRAIYNYHARTLGWGDIGYNMLIDRFGNVYEGRHGRGEDSATREILSDDVVAGHVYAHNYGSTGIAAIGNFDEVAPDNPLLDKIEDALTFACGRHFIEPGSTSDFLQSDLVWHNALANISGHDDSVSTACPGAQLKPHLDTLRANVASRLLNAGATPAPDLTETTGAQRELQEPAGLSFTWSASDGTAWYTSLEGWDKASDSENISYLSGYEQAGYNDPLAMQQVWMGPDGATTANWSSLPAGRYTMHVRSSDGFYAATRTYLIKPTSTSPTRPGKPPRNKKT